VGEGARSSGDNFKFENIRNTSVDTFFDEELLGRASASFPPPQPRSDVRPPRVNAVQDPARRMLEQSLAASWSTAFRKTTASRDATLLQGYLARKKLRPPRTLAQTYAWGPMLVLGGWRFLISKVPPYGGAPRQDP